MQYRDDKHGNPLSVLGYGCMRFSKNGGRIDLEKAEAELRLAIEGGINYFDSAYIYPGSEAALGEILSRGDFRKQINIATKLPHYLVRTPLGSEKIFAEQLKRLKTDYIDYYLIHMINDATSWDRLVKLGLPEWIAAKKAAGQIRRIGFSYHGNADNFARLLDVYDWEFCQIQYNYLDEYSQAGKKGLQYAAAKGLPVIVMGPLRGGRLTEQLPAAAQNIIAADEKGRTAAQIALSWLWDQPEVTCVLSGMNSQEMIRENIACAEAAKAGMFDDYDRALIDKLRGEILSGAGIGCTGCGYCLPCPHGVDIPFAFYCYNMLLSGANGVRQEYMQSTAMRREQSGIRACSGCGKCEQLCPQGIAIRSELKNAGKELEGFLYKTTKWVVKTFKLL